MLQFIWVAVSCLLKLSGAQVVFSFWHTAAVACATEGDSSGTCVVHLSIFFVCSHYHFSLLLQYPIWLHKTLQNKQNSLCCSSSQACFFLLREISSKVNYWVILISDRLLESTALFFLPWWSLSIPLLPLNWCHWWDSWEMLLNLHFLIVPSEKKRNYKLF